MLKPSDDLEMIVCGAFIAGCMESRGEIYTDTDMELTGALVEIYNDYCRDCTIAISFAEYVEEKLRERFKTT